MGLAAVYVSTNDIKFTSNHLRLANIHIEQHVLLVTAFF